MAYSETIGKIRPNIIALFNIVLDGPSERFWFGLLNASGTSIISDDIVRKIPKAIKTASETITGSNPGVLTSPATFNPDVLQFPQFPDAGNPSPGNAGGKPSAPIGDAFPNSGNETFGDVLFYIRDVDGAPSEIVALQEPLGGTDSLADFIPYRMIKNAGTGAPGSEAIQDLFPANFYGIVVNGVAPCQMIGRKVDNNGKIRPAFASFFPNDTPTQNPNKDPTKNSNVHGDNSVARLAITKVRSVANYQGSVVYAGFHSWNPQASSSDIGLQDQGNWAIFSAPTGSDYGPFEISGGTSLRIGETTGEPITKVAVNAIATDALGVKGQLIFFTSEKVAVYDGLPPIPADTTDTNFQSIGLEGIGCVAPHTVVRTDQGLFFLGSDGMVYHMPISNPLPPRPVARAIGPDLKQLDEVQHRLAWAEWFDDHYMLSIPGNPLRKINTVEWWGDLRFLNPQEFDYGVRWYGPQDRHVACYSRGRHGASKEVLMGGTFDGQIWQLHQTKQASDPRTRQVAATEEGFKSGARAVNPKAVLNHIDFGTPHEAKTFMKVRAGIGVTADVDVDMIVSVISADDESGVLKTVAERFSETVVVSKGELGTVEFGEDPLGSEEGFELVEKYFSQRMRGRAITLTIEMKTNSGAAADPRLKIQDLALVGRLTGRR